MKKHDYYYWRLFATGLGFILFGLGGLIIRFIISPILRVTSRQDLVRQHRAQKLIHLAFRLFIFQMRILGVLSYDARGIHEKLNKPGLLVIANHPTLIDVVFLISFIKQTNCIVRKGLFTNPFTSGPAQNANYIPNSNAQQLIEDCVRLLKAGESVIIFPEGTRTSPGNCHPKFQRGAANIAIRAQVRPDPVRINCLPRTLSKGEKWYQIPHRRPHWTFEAGDPIDLPETFSTPKAARQLHKVIETYFYQEDITYEPGN
jgi:1-acyl-sn-glycerol-3-phosphate acyltransferase